MCKSHSIGSSIAVAFFFLTNVIFYIVRNFQKMQAFSMKRFVMIMNCILLLCLFSGCQSKTDTCQIAATTLPVYEFAAMLCEGTDLMVCQIITQEVSCLHDYTLQSSQMRAIEAADTLIISGAGLEDFLDDALSTKSVIIDASSSINLLCPDAEEHHDHSHHHDKDPHIWLSPENAKTMAVNICTGLVLQYPKYADSFSANLDALTKRLDNLSDYGKNTLSQLSCRELITFHDGFSYFADAFDLTVLKAVEEDAGSEASAAELKELIGFVEYYSLPAIFTETNGSTSSAKTVATETGSEIYCLDMAMSGTSYFDAMYHNIDTVKEALG